MELFQLRSFLQVADEGSITRAAEALFLTQPAVTQHVHSLERELGVALFDRTGRGVQLSAAGAALREYVRQCVALLDEGKQAIMDLREGAAGRISIGAGVTTSIFRLPGWLRAFKEAYPAVDVIVRTGRSKEVSAWVLDREIDMGLVTSPADHPDLQPLGLYEEEIVLVAPPGHPLACGTVSTTDLADAALILFPEGTGFRDYLDRALASAGVSASVKMETDSLEAIKSFVAVGLGASFLPAAAVEAEVTSGLLARVSIKGLPPLKRTTSLIRRRDRYVSTAARGFMDVLSAQC